MIEAIIEFAQENPYYAFVIAISILSLISIARFFLKATKYLIFFLIIAGIVIYVVYVI